MPRGPDGRTVLTEPRSAQQLQRPGRGARRHLLPFIPDTNAIEALNRQLRKAIKTKGSFPTEDAARKLIYLAIHNAVPQWTRTREWTKALLAFKIQFGDRLPTLQSDNQPRQPSTTTSDLTPGQPPADENGTSPVGRAYAAHNEVVVVAVGFGVSPVPPGMCRRHKATSPEPWSTAVDPDVETAGLRPWA